MGKSILNIIIIGILFIVSHTTILYGQQNILDAAFGDGGKKQIDIGFKIKTNGNATAMAIQADGKILVGAIIFNGENSDLGVKRYNVNGSVDSSFGIAGQVVFRISIQSNEFLKSMAIQSDGKIILAGDIYTGQPFVTDYLLMRLLPNGAIDESFGAGGKLIVNVEQTDLAEKVLIQQDGKIVLTGLSNNEFTVIRFTTVGNLDANFSDDGKLTIPFENRQILATANLQPDGKIILTGTDNQFEGNDIPGTVTPFYNNFFLIRINTNGTLDNTFDEDGVKTLSLGDDPGSDDRANSTVLTANGKILVAGSTANSLTYSDFAIIRLDSLGKIDSTFDDDGILVFHYGAVNSKDFIKSISLQEEEKIVFLGESDSQSLVSRLDSTGTLDVSFGTLGKKYEPAGAGSKIDIMELQSDFKIVLAGEKIVRLDEDGNHDTSFDNDGIRDFTIFTSVDKSNAIAILPDGKIIMAGITKDTFPSSILVIIKLNVDGTPDNSFGNNGKFLIAGDHPTDQIKQLEIQSDGKIIFSSTHTVGRLTTQGSLDPTYGNNGIIFTPDATNNDLEIQPDGKLLVLTEKFLVYKILRYNTNGTLDPSFEATLGIPGLRMKLQDDGKIIVATIEGDDYVISRIQTNGLVDNTFGNQGVTIIDSDFSQGFIEKITIQKFDKILLAGYYQNFSGSKIFIARLRKDGILDPTFSDDGINIIPIEGQPNANSVATDIISDRGKSIIVTGFSDFGSIKNIVIASLNEDGTLDNNFVPGGMALFPYSATNYSRSDYFVRVAFASRNRLWVSATSEGDFLLMKVIVPFKLRRLSSVEEITSLNNIVYPNPSIGVAFVQINPDEFSELKIYNSIGEFILQQSIKDVEVKIDLSGYPKGVYLIKISGEEKSEELRIVID